MSYSYSVAAMREYDRLASGGTEAGLERLMEAAGGAVCRETLAFASQLAGAARFLVLCGKGNNGGDGLVAARLLAQAGRRVQIVAPFEFGGLAARMAAKLPEALRQLMRRELSPSDLGGGAVVVDGLLGTGFRGTLAEPLAGLVEAVNASHCPVVSIDCPSGLNADDGTAGIAIQADLTVALAAFKTGFLHGAGPRLCGRVAVAPLPGAECLPSLPRGERLFGLDEALPLLPRFGGDVHKFRRGAVLVVGGSVDYPGAPLLTASAALHAGAGLVTALLPQGACVNAAIPLALIVRHAPDGGRGALGAEAMPMTAEALARATAVAMGPGLTVREETRPLLEAVLACGKPCVLDADGLNLVARHPECWRAKSAPTVLTPHAGEYERLRQAFGLPEARGRAEAALALAARLGAVVALKGARTVVATPEGDATCNLSGCPALATAGAGDVLTGLTAAFLAQGLAAPEAARLAVFLHGRAGEDLSLPRGQHGFIADDLPREVAALMRTL